MEVTSSTGVKKLSKDGKEGKYTCEPVDKENSKDAPVIVKPLLAPAHPQTHSGWPLNTLLSEGYPAVLYYPSQNLSQQLSDMGSRLSGWFSYTFNTSSTDLPLPANFANSAPLSSSTKKMGGIALLTAVCTGKGHLDETLCYK
jgi:cysteine protease ATG4